MKYSNIFFTFLAGAALVFAGCFGGNPVTTIYVENQTNKNIDSVIIHVDGHKCIMGSIPPNSTSSIKVSRDSIASNKHDVVILPVVYIRDSSITSIGHYNDLSAEFMKSYRFVLGANLKLTEVFK